MNTPERRFVHVAERALHAPSRLRGSATYFGRAFGRFGGPYGFEWEHDHAPGYRGLIYGSELRGSPINDPDSFLIVVAGTGGGVTGREIQMGLALTLPSVDYDTVHVLSPHRVGSIAQVETARATAGTVQIGVKESYDASVPGASSAASFGLKALRAKIVARVGEQYLLLFTREMPTGWPDPAHPERDESALTGRTANVPSSWRLSFAIPYLRDGHYLPMSAGVGHLDDLLAYLRATGQEKPKHFPA